MRPLTEEESKAVFTKLANYIVSFFCLIHVLLTRSICLPNLGQKSCASNRQT